MHLRTLVAVVILLTAGLAACAPLRQAIAPPTPTPRPTLREGPAASAVDYWPTRGWRVSPPAEQSMDPERLAEATRQIKAQGLGVDSFLVVRNGYVVSETYYQPYDEIRPHVLYSVTKSVVSTLVGIAIDEGRIPGVGARVLDQFPGRSFEAVDADKRAMTLRDVLTMTSGLAWTESDAAISGLYNSRDWLGKVLGLRMSGAPGSTFRYCSGCSQILSAAVARATRSNTYDYAREKLFAPLGIASPEWERASDGTAIGGWGLYLTPRDMAKLGYLFLNDGVWEDRQIVAAGWVREATAKHVVSDDTFGYGYQWWCDERVGGYFARGLNGQLIVVVPDRHLVVVVTANQPDDHPLIELIEDYVIPAAK